MQHIRLHRRSMTGMLLALALVPLAWAQVPSPAQPEPQALAAAAQWLAQTDAGHHAAGWDLAATSFRAAVSTAQWRDAAQRVLGPLGAVLRRELNGSKATRSLPGVPDGDYLIFSYQTDFSHKAGAIETLSLAKEADGQWRVLGYFVR